MNILSEIEIFFEDLFRPRTSNTLVGIIASKVIHASEPSKGVWIVQPDESTQAEVAALLTTGANADGERVEFYAAAMCQESRFAPNCENGNYLGANPNHTPEGTDWGIGQVNGRELALLPDFEPLTWPQRIARIKDPVIAVPLFCDTYKGLLTWADAIIARTDTTALWAKERNLLYADGPGVWPRWTNRYWLAALAYNRGRHGALQEAAAGQVVPHPADVALFCDEFCAALGTSPIM